LDLGSPACQFPQDMSKPDSRLISSTLSEADLMGHQAMLCIVTALPQDFQPHLQQNGQLISSQDYRTFLGGLVGYYNQLTCSMQISYGSRRYLVQDM
jgi:hypothetical protein